MASLIQKHAKVKGQRSNHHIFKFQPNPSWAKKRPNRYTSFRLDRKVGFQNTFYTKCINVIIESIGPSIILRSIYIRAMGIMVSEKFFFKFFPIICLWELYVATATRVPIQSAQKSYAVFPPP